MLILKIVWGSCMITQIIEIDDWNFAMDQAQRLSNMHLMQRSWLSYVISIIIWLYLYYFQ